MSISGWTVAPQGPLLINEARGKIADEHKKPLRGRWAACGTR